MTARSITALVGAMALVPAVAHATPTARLVYARGAGAEACPDAAALGEMVTAHLGYNPFRPFADNTLSAEVHREAKGFAAAVTLVDAGGIVRGARHLRSDSDNCTDVTRAMALSMSIALDPLSLMRPRPAAPALTTPPAAAESGPEVAPAELAPSEGARVETARVETADEAHLLAPAAVARGAPGLASLSWFVGAGPTGSVGSGPAPAVGATAFAGILWQSLSVEAAARADLPATHSTSQGGRVRSTLALAMIAPCAHLGRAFLCAVGALGQINVSATAVSQPRAESGLFAAVGPRVGATLPLGGPVGRSFGLRAYGDALFLLTPYDLSLNNTPVFSAPRVTISFTLAGVFHFS